MKSWLPGVENERNKNNAGKTTSKKASEDKEERQGIRIAKKRTQKKGKGRETERGELTRIRSLKTAQRSHARAMNEVVGE